MLNWMSPREAQVSGRAGGRGEITQRGLSLSLALAFGLVACKADKPAPTAKPAAAPGAIDPKPGAGVTLRPGRGVWATGYFTEALARRGLGELGYKVDKPKELANQLFYKALVLGDLDYWVNGWFPMQNKQLPKEFADKAEKVGYVMKAGGLTGYVVSKREVDKFGIKSLDDFKRPEVKKAFDANGDGKADLVSAPVGWAGALIVAEHLKRYGLQDHIKASTASYEAGMASTYGRFKAGEPVFFWTWAPNWTIHKMKPGKDIMWINVPRIDPLPVQEEKKERMTQTGVVGAVTDPIKLGFVVCDVRAVGNKQFLAKNPAAKRFLELFKVDLEDVNAQNTRMNDGEKTEADVERHVDDWIKAHPQIWQSWLTEARAAAAKAKGVVVAPAKAAPAAAKAAPPPAKAEPAAAEH